jgi:hypothetical protein
MRPLGTPRNRLVDNIKMDLVETGWDGMDWIGLAQDRDKWSITVNVVMNLQILSNVGKQSRGYTTDDLSSSAQLRGVSQLSCVLYDWNRHTQHTSGWELQ